jgi:O-antigen ligase
VDLLMVAIIGMILTYVWRVQVLWAGILAPLRLAAVFTLVAAAGWFLSSGGSRRFGLITKVPLAKGVAAFAALTVVSAALGIYITNSVDFLRNTLVGTFAFFILTALAIRSVRDVERMALTHVIGAFMFCVVVNVRFQVGASGRLGNLPSYDANDLAMLLVCVIPLCVHFLRAGAAAWQRAIMGFGLVLFVVILIKTGSRGGFLGFIAVLAYILTTFKSVSLKIRTLVVSVAVATLLFGATDRYWELMRTISNPTEDYNWSGNSERGRMEVWKRGIGYMLDRPLSGVGVNNFGVAEGQAPHNRERVAQGKGWAWAAPHNSFVQVGTETGVTGLLLMIWMVYAAYTGLRRLRDRGSGDRRAPPTREAALAGAMMAGLVGYCVAGFFLSQGYSPFFYGWLGMTVGLMKLEPFRSAVREPSPGEIAPRRSGPIVVPS